MAPVIDILMKIDEEDKRVKEMPMQHYLVDLRYFLLIPKIAKVTGRYKDRYSNFEIEADGEDGICENQFSMFLKMQNDFYGDNVD